jgi:hypothetical protein
MIIHERAWAILNGLAPEQAVQNKVEEFFNKFNVIEIQNDVNPLLLSDNRSNAFYLICHIDANNFVPKCDLDAVLDPNESEDYKLNREIYTDTYAYKVMETDAVGGRSFEDLVVEYDTSYREDKPLKVFGGQHRITAIMAALKKNVSVIHGIRVYFNLNIEQKVNIAMANNTSIAVSNDLLDRMQEDFLGTDLRKWCQAVGLLDQGQNFADRRSPEGIPTVRIARTLIVNYFRGKHSHKEELHSPIVCSSGPGIDESYRKVRDNIDWNDQSLKNMGEQFAKMHKLQRQIILSRTQDRHMESANKAIHPCVTASWAYAAGLFQKTSEVLAAHYGLTEASLKGGDPLNAKALLGARLKGVDPDTYRGLGARINQDELGRMLEVFTLQATKAKERGITPRIADAAIKSFEAKKAKEKADKALKGI